MRKLTFNYLTVESIGVFKKRQTLHLSPNIRKNIILIEGMNGSGKTTILQLLQIALFGKRALGLRKSEYDKLLKEWTRLDIISQPKIEIEISLTNNNEINTYKIIREWIIKSNKISEELKVYKNKILTSINNEEWNNLIDDYLPVDLAELFFFDGEKIEQLANPLRMPEILRKSIKSLLGIDELDDLYVDLSAYERRILLKKKSDNQNISDNQKILKKYLIDLDEIEKNIELISIKLASNKNRLDIAKKNLEKIKQQAEKKGLSVYKKSIKLNAELNLLKKELSDTNKTYLELVSNPIFPLTIADNLLKILINRKKKETSNIDPDILINYLKVRDKHIIDSLIALTPENKSKINKIFEIELEKFKSTKRDTLYLKSMPSIDTIENNIFFIKNQKNNISTKISNIKEKIINLQTQIASIPQPEKIKSLQDDVANSQIKLIQLENEIKSNINNKERLIIQKKRVISHIDSLKKTLLESYKDTEREKFTFETSKRIREILNLYQKELLKQKSAWLSNIICTHFNELTRKKDFIHKITINPDNYQVNLYQTEKIKIPIERLSAGERQILATALLRALMSANKSQLPVIVDTPLARLDGVHRINLVRNFYTKVSHQVMILSTDEEITGTLRNEIDKSLSRTYNFIFNEEEKTTLIVEKKNV